jgi:hypothetical protein
VLGLSDVRSTDIWDKTSIAKEVPLLDSLLSSFSKEYRYLDKKPFYIGYYILWPRYRRGLRAFRIDYTNVQSRYRGYRTNCKGRNREIDRVYGIKLIIRASRDS